VSEPKRKSEASTNKGQPTANHTPLLSDPLLSDPHISTSAPSSMTRSGGIRKNSVGRVAMRTRPEWRRSRYRAIPGRELDLTLVRPTKKDTSEDRTRAFKRPPPPEAANYGRSSRQRQYRHRLDHRRNLSFGFVVHATGVADERFDSDHPCRRHHGCHCHVGRCGVLLSGKFTQLPQFSRGSQL
jgi:hypothetical protein